MHRAWLIFFATAGVLACVLSCTEEGRDPGEDAGPAADAGPRDSGAREDAGSGRDAGREDDAGSACASAAECQDGEYCNGYEVCTPGAAGAGPDGCGAGVPPCGAATCDEATDTCGGTCDYVPPPECARDEQCLAVPPCAGDETCVDGACVAGSPVLCAAPTRCIEARGATCAVPCVTARECDDGVFCNGLERCVSGGCEPGRPACEGSSRGPLCDEAADTCYCAAMADCPDDGLYCNGLRYCNTTARECRILPVECGLRTCIEARNRCESVCATDADCSSTTPCFRAQCVSGACTTPVSCTYDSDGDGYAGPADGGSDCDDTRAIVSPARSEICDAMDLDEDCNGLTFGTRDTDRDGAVDAACCNDDGRGRSTCGTDCDDTRPSTHPGATEACNGVDDDCDSGIDEGVLAFFYRDVDGDGDGDGSCTGFFCSALPGWVSSAGDCDETNESLGAGSSRCAASGEGVEVCTDGAWAPQPCAGGTTCRPQPDGTGLCI